MRQSLLVISPQLPWHLGRGLDEAQDGCCVIDKYLI